jgi:Fur family ferric uptake transcriptional regulator
VTASPDTPPLQFETLEDAIAAIRRSGLRLSTPRRLVLEALFAADGPVSAAHLTCELRIDESSVYRNLEVLEEHGVVRHVHLGHSPGLYGLVTGTHVEYLYCQRCTRVMTVSPDRLDTVRAQINAEFGFDARFTHFAIVGICAECAALTSHDTAEPRDTLHSHGTRIHTHSHVASHKH